MGRKKSKKQALRTYTNKVNEKDIAPYLLKKKKMISGAHQDGQVSRHKRANKFEC
jgi:hypothetical protein